VGISYRERQRRLIDKNINTSKMMSVILNSSLSRHMVNELPPSSDEADGPPPQSSLSDEEIAELENTEEAFRQHDIAFAKVQAEWRDSASDNSGVESPIEKILREIGERRRKQT